MKRCGVAAANSRGRILTLSLLATLRAAPLGAQQPAEGSAESISNVPEIVRPLVVALLSFQPGRSLPQIGAGVVIGDDAERIYVATALHVVDGAERIWVRFEAARDDTIAAEFVASPQEGRTLDLAVIAFPRARAPETYRAALDRLGEPSRLQFNDPVNPVGCPDEVCWSVPTPADRVLAATPLDILFQSDFVKRGSSGGALLDRWWEVVGVVTQSDPPRAQAIPIDYVVDQARTWGVPVTLRRPRIPRAGYRTSVGAQILFPTASLSERAFSSRLDATYMLGYPLSIHAAYLRFAPGELAGCPAGDEGPGLAERAPCEIVLNSVVAGLGGNLVLGHLTIRAFGELGFGLVQGRFDRGGVFVEADPVTYIPSLVATAEETSFIAGVGLELEYIVFPRIMVQALGGYWTYDGDPFVNEPDFPAVFKPDIPRVFLGTGLKLGL